MTKGVKMRSILNNPAEQKFIDSYWWLKKRFRRIIFPSKSPSGLWKETIFSRNPLLPFFFKLAIFTLKTGFKEW